MHMDKRKLAKVIILLPYILKDKKSLTYIIRKYYRVLKDDVTNTAGYNTSF